MSEPAKPDYAAIEAAAKLATKGPWTVESVCSFRHRLASGEFVIADTDYGAEDQDEANFAYLSHVDPQTVLSMVSEIRRLRLDVQDLREEIKGLDTENGRLESKLDEFYGGHE